MTRNNRVKQVRATLKISMDEFGKKVGVTRAAISNIENGSRGVTEQMTIAICREFHVNYDWLTTGEGDMFDALPETLFDELAVQYELDEKSIALVKRFVQLDEEKRKIIFEVLGI